MNEEEYKPKAILVKLGSTEANKVSKLSDRLALSYVPLTRFALMKLFNDEFKQ